MLTFRFETKIVFVDLVVDVNDSLLAKTILNLHSIVWQYEYHYLNFESIYGKFTFF